MSGLLSTLANARALAAGPKLVPLFLISMALVGYEITLTRWFSIVSWSEYGYWVISITMVGIAASGVVLNLTKDWLLARLDLALEALPLLLIAALAAGYLALTVIDFNPLALQNQATMGTQLWKIAGYYAALFPYFFLGGTFIGLYFIAFETQISRIYAADLIGAGVAGLFVVVLMHWLHPFDLTLALLPVLLVGGWPLMRSNTSRALLVAITAASAAVIAFGAQSDYNEFKAISAPLRVPESRRVETIKSPKGIFEVLDNFTERLDVDLSNNEAVLGGAEPVLTFGLYGDGNRLTSLPKTPPAELQHLNAALDSLPYRLGAAGASAPAVLLIGTRGGFRIDEVQQLGAHSIVALEPESTLRELIQRYRPDLRADGRLQGTAASTFLAGGSKFDLIDIAADYQGSSDIAKYSFTVEGLRDYVTALKPGGMVSVPISIREFTVYAVKLALTAREALRAAGVADPSSHIIVYRSAWNARILISRSPFEAAAIRRLIDLCDERSFDLSYFPGVDLATLKIWNDLPSVSFEGVSSSSAGRQDALANEIKAHVLPGGQDRPATYDITPATTDRPHLYSVLKLAALERILERIDLVPREEIGVLVSLAVLAQSVVIALLVLSLPLFRPRTMGTHRRVVGQSIIYFAGMGLGFLFIEIYLIEKATYFLNDRTLGFSLTLGAMLLFSGIGSYLSGRYADDLQATRIGLRRACIGIVAICALAFVFADTLLSACTAWPLPAKIALLMAVIAPLGIALGFPFAMGMSALRGQPQFLPWAWSLNGAFSVVASPLANLISVGHGNRLLVALALLLYLLVWRFLPLTTERPVPVA